MRDGESRLSAPPEPLPAADLYRTLIEHSLFGTAVLAEDGTVLYASQHMAEFYGLTPQEAVGRNAIELLHPDDRQVARDRMLRYFAGETTLSLGQELRPLRADGTVIELEFKASPVEIDGKRVMILSAADMTLRNRAQRVLNRVAEAVGSKTGQQFLASLVLNLAATLGVDYAFVAEVVDDGKSARMVAVAQDGRIVDGPTYALADTPCGAIVGAQLCWYPSAARMLFPRDPMLVAMNVEAYAGMPLIDSSGRAIGLLSIMKRSAMPRDPISETALRIYGVRAAAELERQATVKALVEGKERAETLTRVALKNEEKYRRLFANLPVAAWESDWSGALEMLRKERINSIDTALAAFREDPTLFNRIAASLRIAEANRRALALAGVPDREAFGRWISTIAYPPESMRLYAAAAAPVLVGKQPTAAVELQLRRPSGEVIDVLLHLARPENWDDNPSMFAMAVDVTEQKRGERALIAAKERSESLAESARRSEERFRRLFLSLPVAAWESDWSEVIKRLRDVGIDTPEKLRAMRGNTEGFAAGISRARTVAINANALALIGAGSADEHGRWRTGAFTPDSAAALIQGVAPLILGDEASGIMELQVRRVDGKLIDVLMRFSRAENWSDEQTVFAVAIDITEAKRAERELIRANAYLDNLFETANAMIVQIDMNGVVLRLNKMGEELTGYRREELLNNSWFERMVPERRRPNIETFRRGMQDGTTSREGESPIVRRGGEERMIAWRNSAVRDENGAITGLLAVGVDVTDRRKAETEQVRLQSLMLEMAEEWRETFDTVKTPIVITDDDGLVRRLNRAACDLTGKGFREVVGHPIAEIDSGEPWQTASQLVRYMKEKAQGTSAETRDGTGRTWDISVERFNVEANLPPRAILVLWDVTGIVELQESLRRSETMSAMGSLVGAVAHEVRNPLFAISAMLDAYHQELSVPSLAECSSTLQAEVRRLSQLMQELLDYGRPPSLNIEPARIEDVIAEAVNNSQAVARKAGIAIQTKVSSAGPLLLDRGRIRQVFENVIENAVQHSPEGSALSISGRAITLAGRNWFECRVEDQGPGFSPDGIDHAFEPFFTQRTGGTGLGLSIVQRIIEQHSGRVTAGNRPEGGAIITIQLPVAGL